MSHKLYALSAINEEVELGKDGHVIDGTNSGHLTVKNNAGNLIPIKAAPSTSSDELVVQAQLDAVHALAGGYLSYSYDASVGISQLSGQGSGSSGAILYGDTYKVTVTGSFLGQTAEAGDMITALVANADVSDNTSSNTDWMLIEIRTAADLADGVSTDNSSGKLVVKDLGISTGKLGAAVVTEAKNADNSNSTRTYIDRSVTGTKVAVGTLLDENVATATLTKAKLAAAVQTTLTNADTVYGTQVPNLESAIGGSFNSDNDSSIAAQTNYLTDTTITGQLQQADSRLKLVEDREAARKATVTYDGGAQNIGSAIDSGRDVVKIRVMPITVANGSGCTMSIGVSGDAAKYVPIADIDLYENSVQSFEFLHTLTSNEQVVATVTQGTATQGTFRVIVEHV